MVGDLAQNHILPTALRYQNQLIKNVSGLKSILEGEAYKSASSVQLEIIINI